MKQQHIPSISGRQSLIFDADDTLWENNIYFEQSFLAFAVLLSETGIGTREVQAVLDRHQLANRERLGYGARAYATALVDTFQEITGCTDDDARLRDVERIGLQLLDQVMEPIDGVRETLETLRRSHDLYLLTKGELHEQQGKIDRSGIANLFLATNIVAEKTVETYRDIVAELGLDPARTWMIGNSPKSDIVPALRAGINAIFVPHPRTWHLEQEEIPSELPGPGILIEPSAFRDLEAIFTGSVDDETAHDHYAPDVAAG